MKKFLLSALLTSILLLSVGNTSTIDFHDESEYPEILGSQVDEA